MMKKVSYALTTLALINIALCPAIAMEQSLAESLGSSTLTNPSDPESQIKNATESNYRRCVYVSWAGIWWCFSWGED